MHNPESMLENKTHKIHFETQMDHLIPVRREDAALIKKNKNLSGGFCRAGWQKSESKRKRSVT